MAENIDPTRVHCYTNPSFCRQSEFIPDEKHADLPPPLQFQGDDLPPPPPPQQLECGQSNPAFHSPGEPIPIPCQRSGRYVYLEDPNNVPLVVPTHKRYSSLPVDEPRIAHPHGAKYDYIQGDVQAQENQLQRHGSSRYAYIPNQQVQYSPRAAPPANQNDRRFQTQGTGNSGRYADIPGDQCWVTTEKSYSPAPEIIQTTRGRYARVPLQEEDPPALPERNMGLSVSPRNNPATQKLHEILTTPRKPRSRSEERTLSPKRQQMVCQTGTPQRRALTPRSSPSGRMVSPQHRGTPQGTPQGRAFSPNGPQTSTPNKEPSARRCLPLTELSNRSQDVCPASNCGRLRYVGTAPIDLTELGRSEPPPRYAYLDTGPESVPMISSSAPRYQVVSASESHKRTGYQSVESAFVARTAVVPPLSPPHSDLNTTMVSGLGKKERRYASVLLILVGILTCLLSVYLSWSQGRRYYFDTAVGYGACCALAGACRSVKRAWTGLALAALSVLSCSGLLLLAAKAPKAGTPMHDVTAGALCGVSVLGAALAILSVIAPRCNLGRHRRVHSWIPRFSP